MLKPTLLQIEDSPDYSLIFKARFKSYFNIILCESIAEVKKLPLADLQNISLVVCDGNLPDGLGFDALDYLSSLKISAKMVGNSSDEKLNQQMSKFTDFSFPKSQLIPKFPDILAQLKLISE